MCRPTKQADGGNTMEEKTIWNWCRENPYYAFVMVTITIVMTATIFTAIFSAKSIDDTKSCSCAETSKLIKDQTNVILAQTKMIEALEKSLIERLPAR